MHVLNLDRTCFSIRSLPSSALAAVGLAAVPAVATVALGGSDLAGAVVAASLIGGSLAGFAADEPDAAVLEASPTTLLVRRLRRLAVLVTYVAALGAAVAGLVWYAHDGPPIAVVARAREGVAAGGLAAATATWLTRRTGERRPGSVAFLAGLLGPLLVSALAFRVHGLPSVNSSQDAGRWWWLAAASWALALWWSRDQARR